MVPSGPPNPARAHVSLQNMTWRRAFLLAVFLGIQPAVPGLSSAEEAEVIVQGRTDDLESSLPPRVPELVRQWTARTAELLALDRTTPVKVTVIFTDGQEPPGATCGATIRLSREALKRNPGDHGLLVHELVHVLQGYPPQKAPGWIVEGIADWIRYFHFEPERGRMYYRTGMDAVWGRRDLDYRAGYLPAAAFLEFLRREYDPNLLWRLNATLRAGKYRDDFFARRGCPDLDKLWRDFTANWPAAKR